MRRRSWFAALVLAVFLICGGQASAATSQLNVSLSSTRSPSQVLSGQNYAVGTYVYIFTTTDAASVSKVEFYLDGALKHTETKAPYDFNGSNDTAGTALAYSVPSGSHTVLTKVYVGTGVVAQASGTFCGGCQTSVTADVRVSLSNTRSPSESLAGQTYNVGQSIYAFATTSATSVAKVEFYLDGALFHTESTAPYDFNGSNDQAGTALPYSVPSGTHTIQAKVYYGSSVVATDSGTFTGGSAPPPPQSCTPTTTQTLTDSNVREIVGNAYHVQANEWGSSAPFSITNDGCPDLTIASSQINNSTSGAPGAYPSIYKGCHWGYCTSASGLPVQNSTLTQGGKVLTSFDTSTSGVASGDAWDDAYDIWFNSASSTTNNSANGLEMMVWLTKGGPIQPAGGVVASNASIGGRTYNVWYGGSGLGGTISYVLASPATSVSNLDLGPLAADAISRGHMTSSWWLIDVEAGFEPWIGGAGLKANSFSVCTPTC